MFEGFTKETGEFLWELRFNNERPWFLAHKEQYERCLNRPFRALAQESWRLLSERYPERDFRVHVSRIYRDARRLFGRGPYKDHLWFSLYTSDKNEGPSFWFEIGAAGYTYGLGFWSMRPALMERFRRAVDANPARFRRLAGEVDRLGWSLDGEEYKRPKGSHNDALIDAWYNRRWLGVEKRFDLGGEAFTDALPGILCDAWSELMPMHRFLMEVYLACPGEREK